MPCFTWVLRHDVRPLCIHQWPLARHSPERCATSCFFAFEHAVNLLWITLLCKNHWGNSHLSFRNYLGVDDFLFFLFIDFIGVTLVNTILQALGARSHNALSEICVHHPKSHLHPPPFIPASQASIFPHPHLPLTVTCWEPPCLLSEAITPPWQRLSKKTSGP